MSRWDAWRKYIAEGGKGSWPRDEFEMLLDYFLVPCEYGDLAMIAHIESNDENGDII